MESDKMKTKTETKPKLKKGLFFSILFLITLILSIVVTAFLWRLDILPILYFGVVILFLIIFNGINFKLLRSKKGFKRFIGTFLSVIAITLFSGIIYFQSTTLDFLKSIMETNYHFERYYVLALKNNNVESLEDLNNKEIAIGSYDEQELEKLKDKIKKKTSLNYVEKTNEDLASLLLNKDYAAIIVNESDYQIFTINDEDFVENHQIIEFYEIKSKLDDTSKHVNVTKESFNVYIMGVDTYGKITGSTRSDVNMVMTVNPNTNQILITSIPRDYYVDLDGKNSKDKITHAGIYGITTAQKTIESLLEIDINYYVKFNFNALVKLVDAINGIEVNSDYAFTANYIDEQDNYKTVNYSFKKGINSLNGKKALAFVRERKAFALGDRIRANNQQIVLEAVLNKLMQGSIVINYSDILGVVGDNFVTNMPMNNITDLIKLQIKNNNSWSIETQILEGTDSSEYTFTYKKAKSYVMLPKEGSVELARDKINQIEGSS